MFVWTQVILSDTKEQQEMRNFPGPLKRFHFPFMSINLMSSLISNNEDYIEIQFWNLKCISCFCFQREDLHKVDAIEFAQQRAGECMRDDKLLDKSSAALLWNLLILLCRQNGVCRP